MMNPFNICFSRNAEVPHRFFFLYKSKDQAFIYNAQHI